MNNTLHNVEVGVYALARIPTNYLRFREEVSECGWQYTVNLPVPLETVPILESLPKRISGDFARLKDGTVLVSEEFIQKQGAPSVTVYCRGALKVAAYKQGARVHGTGTVGSPAKSVYAKVGKNIFFTTIPVTKIVAYDSPWVPAAEWPYYVSSATREGFRQKQLKKVQAKADKSQNAQAAAKKLSETTYIEDVIIFNDPSVCRFNSCEDPATSALPRFHSPMLDDGYVAGFKAYVAPDDETAIIGLVVGGKLLTAEDLEAKLREIDDSTKNFQIATLNLPDEVLAGWIYSTAEGCYMRGGHVMDIVRDKKGRVVYVAVDGAEVFPALAESDAIQAITSI